MAHHKIALMLSIVAALILTPVVVGLMMVMAKFDVNPVVCGLAIVAFVVVVARFAARMISKKAHRMLEGEPR